MGPAAGAWQETDSAWPGDPRTGVTTVEGGMTAGADLRATLEKQVRAVVWMQMD